MKTLVMLIPDGFMTTLSGLINLDSAREAARTAQGLCVPPQVPTATPSTAQDPNWQPR